MTAVRWTVVSGPLQTISERNRQGEFEDALVKGDTIEAERILKADPLNIDIREAWFKVANTSFGNSVDKMLVFIFLLQQGADFNAQDPDQRTAAHLAAVRKEAEIFQWLSTCRREMGQLFVGGCPDRLSQIGPNLLLVDRWGNTFVHQALISELPMNLVEICPSRDVNLQSKFTRQRWLELDQQFLQLLDTSNLEGETPLILSCKLKNFAIAEWLYLNGAMSTTQDRSGHSAFYYAFLNGVPDPNAPPADSHRAFRNFSLQLLHHLRPQYLEDPNHVLETIVKHKLINNPNWDGHIRFLFQQHPLYVKTQRDAEGNTALHIAAARGDAQLVALMRSLPGFLTQETLEAKNQAGQTPQEVALEKGHADTAHLLSSIW